MYYCVSSPPLPSLVVHHHLYKASPDFVSWSLTINRIVSLSLLHQIHSSGLMHFRFCWCRSCRGHWRDQQGGSNPKLSPPFVEASPGPEDSWEAAGRRAGPKGYSTFDTWALCNHKDGRQADTYLETGHSTTCLLSAFSTAFQSWFPKVHLLSQNHLECLRVLKRNFSLLPCTWILT